MDIQLIAIKALQLLCCLSLLVLLHEGGHFGFAKLFKIRVTRFYMFFNPSFHLWSSYDNWFRKLLHKPLITERSNDEVNFVQRIKNLYYKWTGQSGKIVTENVGNKKYNKEVGTEYGIGWLPLGGYCSIDGMVDETTTKEKLEAQEKDEHPEELFLNHPVWQRFLVMVGGVLMNLITAFVLYSFIMFTWGRDVLPMRNLKDGFAFNKEAQTLGFRNGDIPIKVDGSEIEGLTSGLIRDISNAETVTVLRQGKEVVLQMPEDGLNMMELMEMEPAFFTPVLPVLVDTVFEGTPAAKAGITKGARLLAVDGHEIQYWHEYDSLLVDRKSRTMHLVYLADGAQQPDSVTLTLSEDMKMGVGRAFLNTDKLVEHLDYTAVSCIPAGLKYGWNVLVGYVNDLKYVPTKKGAQSVGSFITIGSIFPASWDWQRFWELTALISIILAVMNILPIPGLDGGHVVLLLYEAVVGRAPGRRVMVWLEYIGLGILCALMLLAFSNDIIRWILPSFVG